MRSSIPDRGLIREYLLGRLDDNQEIESELSEKIFLNDELCDAVDTVEDEIIDEYLDGTLNPADRNAVDSYFLRSPARQEKKHFAELLRHYFETGQGSLHQTRQDVLPALADQSRTDARQAIHWSSRFSTYGLAALTLLVFVGLVYISAAHRKQADLESELARERQRSASLAQQAQLSQSSIVLTLVSTRDRGAPNGTPQIDIKPSTTRVRVEIALQAGQSEACDVRLETRGGRGPIWSAKLLPIVSPSGDVSLVFDVPTQGIESGGYSFAVSSGTSSSSYYDFNARVAQ